MDDCIRLDIGSCDATFSRSALDPRSNVSVRSRHRLVRAPLVA
jgi:hypothetical protein